MIREKEIKVSALKYLDIFIPDVYGISHGDIYEAFMAGADWADKHPKSPWISVKDDLPCNHEELLENENCTKKVLVVLAWNEEPTKKHIDISDMCNVIGSYNVHFHWRCNGYYTVTHWRKLPDLPKE